MAIRLVSLLNFFILVWSSPLKADWLYHGKCEVNEDPMRAEMPIISVCAKAKAGSWLIQKSKTTHNTQPDALHRAHGFLSLFLTPWVSFHTSGYVNVFISRTIQETTNRDAQRDSWSVQIGNNALSRHRVHFGKGRPLYRIDHQQRKEVEYAWNIPSFEAPVVNFASYVYDNQLDWTIQLTYGTLTDIAYSTKQRLFSAARFMYDMAALEGTRIVLGGWGDGLLRRTISLGMININGKGDETAVELSRSFSQNPYDPDEFKQNIRVSYLSHEQQKTRIKFQYDDFFRTLRLAGIGAVYAFEDNADLEFQLGYAKHEDDASLSHGFLMLHAGVHL